MGFFDWFNGLMANATTAFQGAVILIASVVGFIVMAKAKFAFTTVIIAGNAVGLAIFLAVVGGNWVSGLIREETVNATASVVVVYESVPTAALALAA